MARVTDKDALPRMELAKNSGIELHSSVDAEVRQIPGAELDAERGTWVMPLSWAACVAAREVLGPELEVGPALRSWIASEFTHRVQPAMEARGTPLSNPCRECGLPREWWRRGLVRDIRRDRIYCTNACRQRAYGRRHRG